MKLTPILRSRESGQDGRSGQRPRVADSSKGKQASSSIGSRSGKAIGTKGRKFETKKEFSATGNFHKRGNRFVSQPNKTQMQGIPQQVNDSVDGLITGAGGVFTNSEMPAPSDYGVTHKDFNKTPHCTKSALAGVTTSADITPTGHQHD